MCGVLDPHLRGDDTSWAGRRRGHLETSRPRVVVVAAIFGPSPWDRPRSDSRSGWAEAGTVQTAAPVYRCSAPDISMPVWSD
jgi:hypothetical protein